MKNELSLMFANVLYKTEILNYKHVDVKIQNLVYDSYEKNKTNTAIIPWKCDTFTTFNLFNLNDNNMFFDLKNEILKHVYHFAEQFNIFNKEIIPTHSWINLAKFGAHQEWHIHNNSHFSFTYYVKVPSNSGKIIFANNRLFSMYVLPHTKDQNPLNSIEYPVEPIEGNLFIFRSDIYHMVEINKSDDDRISVSGNFVVSNETRKN